MTGVLLAILFVGVAVGAIFSPAIGVVAAYFVGVFNPQSVWWWHFDGMRPVYWILMPTLAGCAIAFARGRLDFNPLRNRRTIYLLFLLLSCAVSSYAAPYSLTGSDSGVRDALVVLETLAKLLLMVMVGSVVLSTASALRANGWMIVVSALYMIYWANDRYLSGAFLYRLPGPTSPAGDGTYVDENAFATFFVCSIPFLWYFGAAAKAWVVRWTLWLAIPFGWHAVFLTGSRGGLLALAVVTFYIAIRSGKRWLGLLIVPAFLAAFVLQAGDIMKDRFKTVDDYSEEASAQGRLQAWEAAGRMIMAHPVTGIGPGAFVRAFPSFSDKEPRQAHNTFLQMAAEFGVIGGAALLATLSSCLFGLWRQRATLTGGGEGVRSNAEILPLLDAVFASLLGMLVCASFLTLQLFEYLYMLIGLSNAAIYSASGRAPTVAPRECLRE